MFVRWFPRFLAPAVRASIYALLDAWVDMETCARELTWICEHWDRIEEANALRIQYMRGAAEQLRLF